MEWLHNTKLWLIIIAIGHTALGAGGSYANHGNDALAVIGFFAVVGLYLFYAALMTEGQTQKRLAVVLCGPVVVWFLLCAVAGLEMFGEPAAPLPGSLMPIVLWGMPALSGLLGWNMDEGVSDEPAEA